MKIGEFEVEVIRKKIKNLHLSVKPPEGRVVFSGPLSLTDKEILDFLEKNLEWIRFNHRSVREKIHQTKREFLSGEVHYFLGRAYTLQIIPSKETPEIRVEGNVLEMRVSERMPTKGRASLLFAFYRRELRRQCGKLMEKWLEKTGESSQPVKWEIEKRKRKWGICFPRQRKIGFNIMLARVPLPVIEYVVVHELVHLKIHGHSKDFYERLTRLLPDWKKRKKELDEFPSLYVGS